MKIDLAMTLEFELGGDRNRYGHDPEEPESLGRVGRRQK
jgi:hypothetical protein